MEYMPAIAFELNQAFVVFKLGQAHQARIVTKDVHSALHEIVEKLAAPLLTSIPISVLNSNDLDESIADQKRYCYELNYEHHDQEVVKHLIVQFAWGSGFTLPYFVHESVHLQIQDETKVYAKT